MSLRKDGQTDRSDRHDGRLQRSRVGGDVGAECARTELVSVCSGFLWGGSPRSLLVQRRIPFPTGHLLPTQSRQRRAAGCCSPSGCTGQPWGCRMLSDSSFALSLSAPRGESCRSRACKIHPVHSRLWGRTQSFALPWLKTFYFPLCVQTNICKGRL